MFFNPVWHSEVERSGKWRCTPWGYTLHGFSDLIRFCALLFMVITMGRTIYFAVLGLGEFHRRELWILPLALFMELIGKALYHLSWAMAHWKGFVYNQEWMEASWVENGERQIHTRDP